MTERFLEVLPISCLAGLIYGGCRFVWLKRRGNTVKWTQGGELLRLLFVCYLTGLVNLVLVPPSFWANVWFYLRTGQPGGELHLLDGGFNFVPVLIEAAVGDKTLGAWDRMMLVWNVLAFVPLGLLLPFALPRTDMRRALLTAVGVPLVIELLQPLVGRACDVDDLICNFVGVMLGYDLAQVIRSVTKR